MKLTLEIEDIEQMTFIATCPRSGSSATARALVACGAFVGTHRSKPLNPLGFYENPAVNRIFHWACIQAGLPQNAMARRLLAESGELPEIPFLRERMALEFRMDGYKGGTALFKHAQYMFFHKQINKAFPDAVWVLPIRDEEEVLDSMMRSSMDITEAIGRQRIRQFMLGYDAIRRSGATVLEVHTGDLIVNGNTDEIEAVCRASGLTFDKEAVLNSIDKSLWNRSVKETQEAAAHSRLSPREVNRQEMKDGLYSIRQDGRPVLIEDQQEKIDG